MKVKQIIIIIVVLIIGVLIGRIAFNTEKTTATINSNDDLDKHWTCSMHPQIDLPEFGDCPICGMDLIQKAANTDGDIPENAFRMTENAMALANVETFEVGGAIGGNEMKSIVLSGKIKINEKGTSIQVAYFGGRIEKIYIKSTGEHVTAGELIATIYSPELVSAQNELIEAIDIKEEQPELYNSIRNKIKLWKITETQIQNIENTKKVIANFNLYADVTGYVTEIYKEEGGYIVEGDPLFKVANLENVWAEFDVYEQNIKAVYIDQIISMTLNAYPNMEIKSKIDFIDPNLDAKTRIVIARATVANENKILKPGMFVSAVVYADTNASKKKPITIPKSAVLWTGKRSIVYVKVKKDAAVFEMRKVKLGADWGDYYEIISGLKKGDMIVSNGTFTVDAAAQLMGKNSMMSALNDGIEPLEVDSLFLDQLNYLLEDYMKLKDDLVLANSQSASESAEKIKNRLLEMPTELLRNKETHQVWMESNSDLSKYLNIILLEDGVEKKRLAFINLSDKMINIVKVFGAQDTVYIVHCPMANDNKGGDWISFENEVINPYFGDKMLHCGKVKQKIIN